MIKNHWLRQPVSGDDNGLSRIVGGTGKSSGRGDKNRRDRVVTGISGGVGVAVKLFPQLDIEAGLLFGFADSRCF